MEKFKRALQQRLRLTILYIVLVDIFMILGVLHFIIGINVLEVLHFTMGINEHLRDYIAGFNLGLYIVVQTMLVMLMVKYVTALRDEKKLKELYIAENDERSKFIRTQIGGTGLNIIVGGIALGTVISGFFNEIVFFTLLGVLLFTVLVKAVLKFMYFKKY